MSESQQLNKIQIRAEILMVISKLHSQPEIANPDDFLDLLLIQEDKKAILDILIKELLKTTEQKAIIICYLLMRLCEKEDLQTELWDVLKTASVNDFVKMVVLNLLKDLGNKVNYEKFDEYFQNPEEVIDADTKRLLHVAIINPEAQIDFLDFLYSLSERDKKVLVESLGDDYTSDELANILAPLFLYEPNTELGRLTLQILGNTKSQLAFHALVHSLEFIKDEELLSIVKKNLSALKLAGVREDNTVEFYKEVLKQSKVHQCFTSYPDGHGNLALIFSREKEEGGIQIFASVVNDSWGLIDCFGFNEISQAEFERIVSRFYAGDERVLVSPQVIKTILTKAEKLTRKTEGKLPYEYICWRSLLYDIQTEAVPVEFILNSKITPKMLSEDDLNAIYQYDFIQRWFLDTDYNASFLDLIGDLDDLILKNNFTFDLENLVIDKTSEIFSDEERNRLDKRILMSAYLKYLSKEEYSARTLLSLYYDEESKTKLTQNILRKSVYEHYVAMKFKLNEQKRTTNIFSLKNKTENFPFSLKQLESMISLIERCWVSE